MRRLVVAMATLGLAACASAPKAPKAPAAGTVVAPPTTAQRAHGRKVSPYAAAKEDPSKRGDYVAGGLYRPGESDRIPDFIPDVDAIPEPEVTDEPRSPIGNRSVYTVLGKEYRVMDDTRGYVEQGIASFYGEKFHGRRTSNLEVYDMLAFTAAHKTLPLPSFARVTNLDNGRSVIVRVNDRGPFHEGRLIDLSYAAAVKLGINAHGTGRVEVRALHPGEETLFASTKSAAPAMGAVQTRPSVATTALDQLVTTMPADASASPASVTETVPAADAITLQVASFTARDNADRALATLRDAGIDTARLYDAQANGRTVWRLRVGPLAASRASELTTRIAGLGFGTPRPVRD